MQLALYAPGLGYYANDSRKFGALPQSGSDFITAPELSPVFGELLALQVREALQVSGTHEVWEFGAGSGALAAQLLGALDAPPSVYKSLGEVFEVTYTHELSITAAINQLVASALAEQDFVPFDEPYRVRR